MLFTFLLVSGAAEKERLALGGEPGRLRRPLSTRSAAFSVHTVLAAIAHIALAERSRMPSFQHRLDLHITN